MSAIKMRIRGILGGTRALRLLAHWRGRAPFWFWSRWPVCGEFEIGLPGGGSIRIAGAENDWLDRVYFWLGLQGDEPETYPVFMALARGSALVLDVGANAGIYTLLACAADPDVRVAAFEPSPRTFGRLAANVAANGWSDRCELHREAVSDQRGTSTFQVPPGGRSVHAGLYPVRLSTSQTEGGTLIEVVVTTVDEACAAGVRPDLVKIDVEGYEDRVLKGMTRVLAESGPDLVMECLLEGPHREIAEILSEYGYSIYHIREQGPVRVDGIAPDPSRSERNFLFSRDPGILERIAGSRR